MNRDYLVSINTDKRVESAANADDAVAAALSRYTHLPIGSRVLVTTWLKGNAITVDTMLGQSTFIRVRTRPRSIFPVLWKQLPP